MATPIPRDDSEQDKSRGREGKVFMFILKVCLKNYVFDC